MKWREPWRNTLRRQAPWKLMTWAHFRTAMVWTAVLFVIFNLRVFASDIPLSNLIKNFWVIPVCAIVLTLLHSGMLWISPLKVSSRPRGIVRSKGDALAVVPWQSIRSFQIYELNGERVLELSVTYSTEPERLYLASKVDAQAVEQELLSHVPSDTATVCT